MSRLCFGTLTSVVLVSLVVVTSSLVHAENQQTRGLCIAHIPQGIEQQVVRLPPFKGSAYHILAHTGRTSDAQGHDSLNCLFVFQDDGRPVYLHILVSSVALATRLEVAGAETMPR